MAHMMIKHFLFIVLVLVWAASSSAGNTVTMFKTGDAASPCSGNYGNTTSGTINTMTWAGYAVARKITFDCDGSSSTVYMQVLYGDNSTREIKPCVWADNAGNPGTLLWVGTKTYNANWDVSPTFESAGACDYSFTSGTSYWVGFVKESSDTGFSRSAGTGTTRKSQNTFGTPTDWDGVSDEAINYDFSCYLTF